jgi:hypothetical protein
MDACIDLDTQTGKCEEGKELCLCTEYVPTVHGQAHCAPGG